ncbi:MAG TPA: GAF domain-containing protein, partial [Nitrospinaceae bacterium]|nr:GAF domain-containing protein [Nitrospinaceae bacterium]
VTIYAVDEKRKEIYSKVTYGNKLGKIRVSISPRSVAGYVAMVKKTLNIPDIKDLVKIKILHPKLAFDDSWEKVAGVYTKSLLTLPLIHGSRLLGVLQLVNKKDMVPFPNKDEKNGLLISQALALALYNHKKNESRESLSRGSRDPDEKYSKVGENRSTTANILLQREDDETSILVRILKDGSRLVYQQIDPPRDVIKLIKEVANIDLDIPHNPHRRKDDPRD